MAKSPTSSLVARVALTIFETFDVSEAEARENAEGVVTLAEDLGGSTVSTIDWEHEVMVRFDGRLKWRSKSVRQRFLDGKKHTVNAYESYIRARK